MRLLSPEFPYLFPDVERSLLLAYPVWFFWGLIGIHKLYLGKPVMALVYALTGGIFGIGWVIDFFTLPWQVSWCNLRSLFLHRPAGDWGPRHAPAAGPPPKKRRLRNSRDIMLALLEHASTHGGVLSVTDGVLATGLSFGKVEKVLGEMLRSGYVDVRNHPDSGVVQYVFPELMETPVGRSLGP